MQSFETTRKKEGEEKGKKGDPRWGEKKENERKGTINSEESGA